MVYRLVYNILSVCSDLIFAWSFFLITSGWSSIDFVCFLIRFVCLSIAWINRKVLNDFHSIRNQWLEKTTHWTVRHSYFSRVSGIIKETISNKLVIAMLYFFLKVNFSVKCFLKIVLFHDTIWKRLNTIFHKLWKITKQR